LQEYAAYRVALALSIQTATCEQVGYSYSQKPSMTAVVCVEYVTGP
jgi:hypothetical protein